MEHLIRKCEEEDLPVLVELCKKHADHERSPYNSTGKQEQLRKAIFSDRQKLFCYVIESNGQMAGYFSYTVDFSTWDANSFLYLDCLYLEPQFRCFGIGELVFDELKLIAKQNDCINIQWQTLVFNDRAIKFYDRIGGTGKNKLRFFIDIRQA